MADKYKQRFAELTVELEQVKATKRTVYDPFDNRHRVEIDTHALLGWEVKAKNLLERACGKDSQHYKHFSKAAEGGMYRTSFDNCQNMSTVFFAAKEDYEGGYLTGLRSLVQAEVFDSELEQANALLTSGYKTASAIIAGTVLETTLRELCSHNNRPYGKADKMNADLAKAGVYNANMAKRITALAGIRNSAAHGKPDEFTDGDVKSMIEEIGRFLAQHLQ